MRTIFVAEFGDFAIEADDDGVTKLHFPGYIPADFRPDQHRTPFLLKAEEEVREFIAGKRKTFTLPLKPCGSGFMLRVWERLVRIPYGEILTYGEVARTAGSPGAARAVGAACRNNPIPLLIPCHRVIGANGKLTGFYGGGLDLKRKLIQLEAGRSGLFG
jgi:O-6-methylguanine DNA methyltransferase